MSYGRDHEPPFVERRRMSRSGIMCSECGKSDVPSVVVFNVTAAGSEENYDGEHSVCRACLENALAMFNDPNLVKTKTPLSAAEKAARAFATDKHGYQKYDSGTEPYVVHLAEVRDVAVEFGWTSTEMLLGAWLHDVLEDTTVTPSEFVEEFGSDVGALVWTVTGVGKNRKERNESTYKKMVEYPVAIPLKLADRIANARASKQTSPDSLFEMYRREYHTSFKDRLQRASGMDPRTVAMWKTLDELFGVAS
jgi:guanosine-3',5'-bis(diphosphate) 3'-pyrophosphohydrolase